MQLHLGSRSCSIAMPTKIFKVFQDKATLYKLLIKLKILVNIDFTLVEHAALMSSVYDAILVVKQ